MDKHPDDGCYVYGLFLEGARWDYKRHVLADPEPKVLFSPLPIVWLKPIESNKAVPWPHYNCPVYKVASRRGVLSTTGHSTNYVLPIKLPSNEEEKYWTKRGTALLCSLSD